MDQPRYLISPKAAIGTAAIAFAALIAAIIARGDAPAETKPEPQPVVSKQPPSAPDAGVPADATDVAPLVASTPPKIEGAKATATVGQLGVELNIDVALVLAGQMNPRDSLWVKASCQLDGDWFAGTGYVMLDKLPAGTSVAPARVRIGSLHAFTAPPSQCQIGFQFSPYAVKSRQYDWLARMCWNGTQVVDKPCDVKPSADVAVSGVRVSTSAYRKLNAPVDLDVSVDAEFKRPLDDKRLEVVADCKLPDGSQHHASARVMTYGVHAGRPFTSRAWLFGRGQQMLDVPESCTVAVEVADASQLVREPVSAFCWRAGTVEQGACG